MYQRIMFFLLMLTGLAVNVQTVNANISGKVSNSAGNAIQNAIVTLAVQGIKDTTASNGSYSFATTGIAVFPLVKPKSTTITLNRDFLDFRLLNPSSVKVEIFDAKGNLLKKESLPNAQAGFYRLNIAVNFHTTKLLIIRASVGQDKMIFHYLPLNNSNYTVNSSAVNSGSVVGKLAKITTVKDTIKVTANNYQAKAVTISSYDTTVNITLDSEGVVVVHLDQTEQTIMGFGINNVWSGDWSDSDAEALFDSTKGLGLSILRIGMEPNGSVANGATSCWADIQKAKARGLKYVIGSTWSPPGGWKTNGSENNGGYLKTEYYTQWADTIAAFVDKVKNSGTGMTLYAMSIGNEPDFASCKYSEPCNGEYKTTLWNDTQMVNFIKIAGPKISAKGALVMAPEASEWLHLWSDSSGCCSVPSDSPSSNPLKGKGYDYGHALYKDTAAWNQVDIIGIHQYDTQVAEPWPSDVNNGVPSKEIWQTEMSGVKWWPEQGTLTPVADDGQNGGYSVAGTTDIKNGIAVAAWVHNGLTVGNASAWCYWWWKPRGTTNEGLIFKDGTDTKRRYTFGNFSRFVRPNMVRVDIAGTIPDSVLISAYKGNSSVVIVAINKGGSSKTVPISISGGTAPTSFTPWVTSESDNLASKDKLTVSNGVLTVTLAGKTVTTFVGK